MSTYSAVQLDATAFLMNTSTAVIGGQLVAITGDRLVGPSTAGPGADPAVVGIALNDAGSGLPVAVVTDGVHRHAALASIHRSTLRC